ncbi:flagellar hook-length control protein FliK [Carnobacterium sp. ISL-102]|uniref:flagellar hook-length control protein FliK n=1 Tax=Carnobacterium sp. ISL-102 TaxID=2819142 RepID=UPI001BE98D13|nr:flagellar hook-length control protein FliK [Carnobacterium sp. ISL-102]MBT2731866.1 flagellar hook-length control protein FliK [Carnobacterium sp. ISL-102]
MKPTPVAPTTSGAQLMPNQQQEMSPKEFEAQLAGYLDKEKPSTIHKESSDAKETNQKGIKKVNIKELINRTEPEESDEEPTEKMLILDPMLLYTGSFNVRLDHQSAKDTSDQSQSKVNQLLDSNEPVFSAQVIVGTGKIERFIQNEDLLPEDKQSQSTDLPREPSVEVVNDLQKSIEQTVAVSEKTVELEKKPFLKPTVVNESASKIQVGSLIKNETSFLVKDADWIGSDQVRVVPKENELVGSILPTGRFLTAEWKNGRMMVNQSLAERMDSTTSLSEPVEKTSKSTVQTVAISEMIASNGVPHQPNLETIESKSTVLTETGLNEKLVSNMKNLESSEAVAQVTEVDKQNQPIQQQLVFEAPTVKQPSVIEAVKQAGIQMVSEVVLQEAETVLSGKQSVAHVTLSPERMGEVRITVELTDNVLLTKIVVDNVETRELLTTGMHRLTDNLDRQNIRLGELTIQLNEHATADSASQERQRKEQKRAFGQKQTNFLDNEIEPLKSEGRTDRNTSRLSILV